MSSGNPRRGEGTMADAMAKSSISRVLAEAREAVRMSQNKKGFPSSSASSTMGSSTRNMGGRSTYFPVSLRTPARPETPAYVASDRTMFEAPDSLAHKYAYHTKSIVVTHRRNQGTAPGSLHPIPAESSEAVPTDLSGRPLASARPSTAQVMKPLDSYDFLVDEYATDVYAPRDDDEQPLPTLSAARLSRTFQNQMKTSAGSSARKTNKEAETETFPDLKKLQLDLPPSGSSAKSSSRSRSNSAKKPPPSGSARSGGYSSTRTRVNSYAERAARSGRSMSSQRSDTRSTASSKLAVEQSTTHLSTASAHIGRRSRSVDPEGSTHSLLDSSADDLQGREEKVERERSASTDGTQNLGSVRTAAEAAGVPFLFHALRPLVSASSAPPYEFSALSYLLDSTWQALSTPVSATSRSQRPPTQSSVDAEGLADSKGGVSTRAVASMQQLQSADFLRMRGYVPLTATERRQFLQAVLRVLDFVVMRLQGGDRAGDRTKEKEKVSASDQAAGDACLAKLARILMKTLFTDNVQVTSEIKKAPSSGLISTVKLLYRISKRPSNDHLFVGERLIVPMLSVLRHYTPYALYALESNALVYILASLKNISNSSKCVRSMGDAGIIPVLTDLLNSICKAKSQPDSQNHMLRLTDPLSNMLIQLMALLRNLCSVSTASRAYVDDRGAPKEDEDGDAAGVPTASVVSLASAVSGASTQKPSQKTGEDVSKFILRAMKSCATTESVMEVLPVLAELDELRREKRRNEEDLEVCDGPDFLANAELCHNMSRVISRLSANPAFLKRISAHRDGIRVLMNLLEIHPDHHPLLIRTSYVLGNIAASNEHLRVFIAVDCGGIDSILSLLRTAYVDLASQLEMLEDCSDPQRMGDESSGAGRRGKDASILTPLEDLLTNLIRLLANLAIDPKLGPTIACCEEIDTLCLLLQILPQIRSRDLALNTVCAMANITFYDVDGSVLLEHAGPLLGPLLALMLDLGETADAVIEAARVLGNLSRDPLLRAGMHDEGLAQLCAILLDHSDEDIVYSVCGVLMNLAGESIYARKADQMDSHPQMAGQLDGSDDETERTEATTTLMSQDDDESSMSLSLSMTANYLLWTREYDVVSKLADVLDLSTQSHSLPLASVVMKTLHNIFSAPLLPGTKREEVCSLPEYHRLGQIFASVRAHEAVHDSDLRELVDAVDFYLNKFRPRAKSSKQLSSRSVSSSTTVTRAESAPPMASHDKDPKPPVAVPIQTTLSSDSPALESEDSHTSTVDIPPAHIDGHACPAAAGVSTEASGEQDDTVQPATDHVDIPSELDHETSALNTGDVVGELHTAVESPTVQEEQSVVVEQNLGDTEDAHEEDGLAI